MLMIKISESSHREKRKDKKKSAFKNSNNMHFRTCTGFYSKGFTQRKIFLKSSVTPVQMIQENKIYLGRLKRKLRFCVWKR